MEYYDRGGAGVIHVTGATAALVAKIFYNGGKEMIDKTELSNLKEVSMDLLYSSIFISDKNVLLEL